MTTVVYKWAVKALLYFMLQTEQSILLNTWSSERTYNYHLFFNNYIIFWTYE